MKTSDFDYLLDESLIAQTPLLNRDSSKLLVLNKNNGQIKHDQFSNIINYLKPGDVLVLNNSKVIPARIVGVKTQTDAVIELLLLKNINDNIWECLVKPAKRINEGTVVKFSDNLSAKCIKKFDQGIHHFEFIYNGVFLEILEELGTMPLPPYIKEKLIDQSRYQTIYAKQPGSAAAPTAGLHFTNDLLVKLKDYGVIIAEVTLHVGLGTFRPVDVDDIETHHMHEEAYEIDSVTADILNQAKLENRRIISVGTTTIRVLESNFKHHQSFKAETTSTNIFIYPGYKFQAVDALITNFHLPKSTLLMLVSAFSDKIYIMSAYQVAQEQGYRFFSFGDAMFITEEL